jgi:hypothetical protein
LAQEVALTLEDLVGLRMWGTNHMADSRGFAFGGRRPSTSRGGEARIVGDYALHLQCAWKLVSPGGPVARSELRQADATPALQAWLDENELIVSKVVSDPGGAFRVELSGGAALEVSVRAHAGDDEAWRLFRPDRDDAHLVQYADGRAVHE